MMNIDKLERFATIFARADRTYKPGIQADSSEIIKTALYARYGNPPMKLINALSEAAYAAKGDVSLLVETTSGRTVVKFSSDSNPAAAKELNRKFVADIKRLLVTLQKKHPNIPTNEWSFFARGFVGIR
jgi:hypothetical protein